MLSSSAAEVVPAYVLLLASKFPSSASFNPKQSFSSSFCWVTHCTFKKKEERSASFSLQMFVIRSKNVQFGVSFEFYFMSTWTLSSCCLTLSINHIDVFMFLQWRWEGSCFLWPCQQGTHLFTYCVLISLLDLWHYYELHQHKTNGNTCVSIIMRSSMQWYFAGTGVWSDRF